MPSTPKLLLLLSTAASCATSPTTTPKVVTTSLGAVRGVRQGGVDAYLGIPYAAPPLGDLRWRPPHPPSPWPAGSVRDATQHGARCVQPPEYPKSGTAYTPDQMVGSEDCLTLSLFVPDHDGAAPVIAFVHGGDNVWGSSSQSLYDAGDLATRAGAVVVTINYRLGALGFAGHPALSSESGRGASGNYGILDVLAALGWIHENIAAFGGDPDRVMLDGQSAGGLDVSVILASPLGAGLFSAAIIQSADPKVATLAQAEATGVALADAVGCKDAATALACLRALDAATVAVALQFGRSDRAPKIYGPNVDGWVLDAPPNDVFAARRHNAVPVIIGKNRDEATSSLRHHFTPVAGLDPTQMTASQYEQIVLAYAGETLGGELLTAYPAAAYASPYWAAIAILSDPGICAARRTARVLAASPSPAVYRYLYTHTFASGPLARLGAGHALELRLLFHHASVGAEGQASFTFDAAEEQLSWAMARYWGHFAATGDPNGEGLPVWPVYEPASDPYLQLDTPVTAGAGIRSAQCDFWDQRPSQLVP